MASVIKCDICGDIYDEYGTTGEFMRTQVLQRKEIGVYSCAEHDYCPKCTKKLLKVVDFMSAYPKKWVEDILTDVLGDDDEEQ